MTVVFIRRGEHIRKHGDARGEYHAIIETKMEVLMLQAEKRQ